MKLVLNVWPACISSSENRRCPRLNTVALPSPLLLCVPTPKISEPFTVAEPVVAHRGQLNDDAIVVGGEGGNRIGYLQVLRHRALTRRSSLSRRCSRCRCPDCRQAGAAIRNVRRDSENAVGAESRNRVLEVRIRTLRAAPCAALGTAYEVSPMICTSWLRAVSPAIFTSAWRTGPQLAPSTNLTHSAITLPPCLSARAG